VNPPITEPEENSMQALSQEKKPNGVFILVDNVGWGSFGVYGGTIWNQSGFILDFLGYTGLSL
jgi:arylsulfatase A-like enzyme